MRKFCIFLCLICCTVAVARPKVALVLGGGGAKGAAEVGVLKVIERAGVPVDIVVGTSIGSIVGGLYAAGYTAAQLDTMFCQQEWISLLTDWKIDMSTDPYRVEDGVTYVFGFPVYDRNSQGFGVIRGTQIEQMLDSMLTRQGCADFGKLPKPFRCVAADFRHAREVVLGKGSVSRAMRASMAIPGVFKPVSYEGMMLVDGGMTNNLPVDVARSMGADIVIAVDLEQKQKQERPAADTGFLGAIASLLDFEGLLNWVTQRPDITKHHENAADADIYIHPQLPDDDASNFGNKNAARIMAIGEQEAERHWQELVRLKD